MDISTLLKKLGHHLEEIRIRALKNLISKLDHGLISIYDLVQEKVLYHHLLEWFNFPTVPMRDEVLDLINRLARHPTAVCLLVDIGAVEFMSQLRPNVEPNLQAKVDAILDCLFRLPDVPTDDQAASCHLQPLTRLGDQDASPLHVDEDRVLGYFHTGSSSLRQVEASPQRAVVNDAVKCLKFSTFPWLTLTSTDKHILSSNESLLQSQDQRLVHNTCELLQDVIMQDFPAEIFLQRPKIIQSLLSLLKLEFVRDSTHHLALQAVSCLHQLCTCLRSRLSFYRDPSFFSTKQETSSQNSSVSYSQETRIPHQSPDHSPVSSSPRPFVIGRTGLRPQGDGQDGDAASSSGSSSRADANSRVSVQSPLDIARLDLTEIENEDSLELQFQQLSLAQFSVLLVEHAVPLLRTGSRRVLLQVLELLKDNLLLLSSSLSAYVWNDDSFIGRELNEKLLLSFESLGDTIVYHNSSACSEQPEPLLEHHRMAFVSIAIFTVRLLQTLLPVEKADEVLPESMVTALFQVSLDMPFFLSYPNIHDSITAYLEVLNAENYRIYKRATEIVHSVECSCSFMEDTGMQNEKHFLELIEAANEAVNSLPYHKHLPLVQKFICLCSKICKSAQASLSVQDESRKVLLKLLSHPLLDVKAEAYNFSLDITKECLGIHNVTKPVSSVCHGIHFLLHTSVLYEISTFGLQDSAEQVNSAAKEILLYLFQGQLMMSALTWNKFIDALHPVIPVLQGHASTEGSLANCILMLSETSSETGGGILPRISRLRAALRLLMSMQKVVRSVALKHLMWHLINENEASVRRPLLEGSNLSTAADMYVMDKHMDLKLDDTGKSLFKDATVGKIYEIFISEAVDLTVKKSAAEQLAVMMQDTSKHDILLQLGVVDKLQSLIQECIHKNGKPVECIMLPCLTLLRKLVYADPSLRHNLAQQPSLLLSLFRVSVILQDKQAVLMEVAALFILLLFDEVARTDTWSDDQLGNLEASPPPPFSLPVAVLRRYHLPVQIVSHHAVSPSCTVIPAPSDPLMSKPVSNMLSIAWNLAWFNGIENLLEKIKDHQRESVEFLEALRLLPSDVIALTVTHIDSGLRACISSIAQAVSHRQVSSAVTKMSIYLLNDIMALKHDSDGSLAILQRLGWHSVLKRFLHVLPACSDDEKLLADVVTFLNKYFRGQKKRKDVSDLNWFVELLKEETNPLLNLLVQVESKMPHEVEELQSAITQKLQKELSALFNTVLLLLTSATDRKCLVLAGLFRTELSLKLLQCVRVSDAPHFYGLPSLERTLRGMVHVTACPGWSLHSAVVEPFPISVKYLTSLLEVISSFYVEWGGNALSFMGKGVTKNAVLCLLHITNEMKTEAQHEDWVSLWSLPYDHSTEEQTSSRMGLAWLVPLWVDRDPEVRFASLGIGAALTSVESGCITLAASCQNISGGLWGMLLNILLDQSECSMVRREATAVLQNLLVMPMPSTMEEANNSAWQSPCVHDEEARVSLVGSPALQALLHHCLFYEHVSQMAQTCYLGRHSFELNFPELGSKEERSSTEDFEDSLKHWQGESGRPSQVHSTIGSVSTSSTQIAATSSLPVSVEGFQPGVVMLSETHNTIASIIRPNAQVQGETDTAASTNTEESHVFPFSADTSAIVTPPLLSALCGLLTNLLAVTPEDTLTSLQQNHILNSFIRLPSAGLLERCIWDLRTPFPQHSYLEDTTVQILSLLQYLSSLSEFLQFCLMLKPDVVTQDDLLRPLLSNVFTCLSIHLQENFDAELTTAFHQTWTDLLSLLTTLLRKIGQISLPLMTTLLSKLWTKVTGTISTCIHLSATTPFLYIAALQFLAVLLAEEGKRKLKDEQSSFPSPTITEHLDGCDGNKASGKHLCEAVLQSYEGNSSDSILKKVSASALMSLLAASTSAQKHALQAGFLDSCIEQMKQIHAQLNLNYMQTEKAGQRKKEETLFKELKTTMQMLRNCLCRNNECKIAAVEYRLANILYSLWPWFVMDDVLMQAALQLLSVFTANCLAACGSVCWASSVQYSQASQRGPTGNTLMHAVIKLSSQKVPDSSVIQQLAFTVLSNLAMSHDCRGVLQKSNFLQHFVSLPLPKSGSKKLSIMANMWLKLLLNISFGDDGQHMIVKFNGCLELLTEMTQCKHKCGQPVALLILHNICFNPASKPKILASDNIVTTLASCLESDSLMIQTIGASALWALMYNNQKAKVPLKNPSVRRRVDEAYSSVRKSTSEADDNCLRLYNLKCLDALTRLLNV